MSFTFGFPKTSKRLKMIDDQGVEEFENATNALDTSHLELLEPRNDEEEAKLDDAEVSERAMQLGRMAKPPTNFARTGSLESPGGSRETDDGEGAMSMGD